MQSHALSFFYLSAPDLLLGMDSDPPSRNVLGIIRKHPDLARDGIELRKFGLQIIEGLAKERVHASWIVPGGVNAPMTAQVRDRILADLPEAKAITRAHVPVLQSGARRLSKMRSRISATAPTMHAGLVDRKGNLQLYDGALAVPRRRRARSSRIRFPSMTTRNGLAKRACGIRI